MLYIYIMASINGLKNIAATSIQNSGEIYLGSDIDPGTAGQALVSGGPNAPVRWDTHTGTIQPLTAGSHITFSSGNPTFDGGTPDTINATPGGGLISGNGIDITGATISTDNDGVTIDNSGGTGTQNQVLKVPGTLTINQNSSLVDTFDGSTNKTINLVGDYLAGDGIDISGHPVPHIEADTDEITISHNVGGAEKLQVLKVPNDLTAGTNITFSSGTTYNGSAAITISATDTDTQLNLTAGANIVITNTGGLNRTIALHDDISNQNTISFTNGGSTLMLGDITNRTPMLYFNLASTTNIIPGAVLATKVQRTNYVRTFGSSYSEYSSNFRTSFVAQSTNVMVEFRAIIRCDNRVFYGGLYDYNAGSYNTDQRNRFNYNDENDQDHSVLTWWMRNLTIGNTYYISPYFRGQSFPVYIYAGHSGTTDGFAPAIMRIIDGGNNVDVY